MLLSFTRTGALPLGKIGERLQVHRTSVTNIIDKLEADGLVRRVPHTEDRRATLAEITDAGRKTASKATEVLNEECFGIASLAPRDLERLTSILRDLRLDAGDFAP
jgi:DNA-binding MarR family transcriptional regulator